MTASGTKVSCFRSTSRKRVFIGIDDKRARAHENPFPAAVEDVVAVYKEQLVIFEAMPHAFWYHFQLPETPGALEMMAKFFEEKLGR